jgi:hypothetical protein
MLQREPKNLHKGKKTNRTIHNNLVPINSGTGFDPSILVLKNVQKEKITKKFISHVNFKCREFEYCYDL